MTAGRLRVLLIAPRFPYPPISGGEKWTAELSSRLSRDCEISLFSFSHPGAETHQAALAMSLEGKTFRKVYMPPRPDPPSRTALPSLPALYWSDRAAAELSAAAEETRPQLAHILFSEMACYEFALPPGLPVVYTEIDSSHLYPWKSYLRESAGLKGRFRPVELFRARRYARRHYPRFDAATFVTASDGRDIARYLSTSLTAVTPNAADAARLAPPASSSRTPGSVLFLGYYPHYPNEDAAIRLVRRIFPLVKAAAPGASLTLAGACPTPAVAALAGPDVAVPGTAPDIREFLWRAEVFAAPVRYGLGTKGKILEAFAAGAPVVASKEAAAGIEGARDGEHLLCASGDREFAEKTALLIADPGLRARLASAALALVKERFSYDGVAATVLDIYRKVLDAR